MSIERELNKRSGAKCELCGAEENLKVYQVLPTQKGGIDEAIFACNTCIDQIENPDNVDLNHWRCLNDSMWNENVAVQVVAWRMLSRMRSAGWPQELLDMMYLDEDTLETALNTLASLQNEGKLIGIISHVAALKERIHTQIKVSPLRYGQSKIEGPGCSKVQPAP